MRRNALRLPLSHHFPSTKSLLKTTGWGLTNCLQQTGQDEGAGTLGAGRGARRTLGARRGRGLDEEFGDLHGVEGCALAQVVVGHEQRQTTTAIYR